MSAERIDQHSFEVPQTPEQPPQTGERPEEGIEQGGPSKEGASRAPATAVPTMPPPAMPTAQTTPPAGGPTTAEPPQTTAATSSSGLQAGDGDLIEKQWVEKAKNIVAQTHEDPYKQKNEMSRVKADYVQKRFNKTLKLDDSPGSTS